MTIKLRNLLLLFLAVIGLAISFFFLWEGEEFKKKEIVLPAVHMYKQPAVSIAKINLKIFYAVPKNRAERIISDWQKTIEQVMPDILRFHELQFRGLSKIAYEI